MDMPPLALTAAKKFEIEPDLPLGNSISSGTRPAGSNGLGTLNISDGLYFIYGVFWNLQTEASAEV